MTPNRYIRKTPYKTKKWLDQFEQTQTRVVRTPDPEEARRMTIEIETALRVAESIALNGNGTS